jgi:hypothetical protein
MRDRRAPELEAELRQLGGLARSGLAGDDDDLVVADGGEQIVPAPGDRQLGRVFDRLDPAHAPRLRVLAP